MNSLTVLPVGGLPEIRRGDDIAAAVLEQIELRDGDVVVVSQKIVSKAEGALVHPAPGEEPSAARRRIALQQASAIVAETPWVLIVRTHHGFVCANGGVDASNVDGAMVTLLPDDPDASARGIRERFAAGGVDVAVIVADTFGRPWRIGQTDVAIGVAGLAAIRDERGERDRQGLLLEVTETAVADELAGAADLVRTKAGGVPVVVIRGFEYERSDGARATDLVRDLDSDLFARGRGMLATALTATWPQRWAGGITPEDLALVQRVAPDAVIAATGPPDRLETGDALEAGLAAGVLADLGLHVRWHRTPDGVAVEAGRAAEPG